MWQQRKPPLCSHARGCRRKGRPAHKPRGASCRGQRVRLHLQIKSVQLFNICCIQQAGSRVQPRDPSKWVHCSTRLTERHVAWLHFIAYEILFDTLQTLIVTWVHLGDPDSFSTDLHVGMVDMTHQTLTPARGNHHSDHSGAPLCEYHIVVVLLSALRDVSAEASVLRY